MHIYIPGLDYQDYAYNSFLLWQETAPDILS